MGPLAGLRVVELSTGVAGPFAGMFLGDYGAEVVKVEPPGGDPARAEAGFAVWNRNKQSVVLDRASEADPRRVVEMLAGADACIYADPADEELIARAANTGLVALHMPPFTAEGTPWAGHQESAGLLSAAGGPSSRQSSFDGGPIHLVYPFPLYEQGIWGAACAVASLIERERSGLGQRVTVAGMHGAMACSPHSFVIDPSQAPLSTDVGPGGRNPTYTTYRCKDGEWLFLAGLTPKFQANAFKTLGVGDLHADPRIGGVPSRLVLPENRVWVRELMANAFLTRTRDEWLEALEVGDCPAGPIGNRDEWLDHPQIVENSLRAEVDDPERGRVVMPSPPIGMSRTPPEIRTPAPRLGEHQATAGKWPRRAASGGKGDSASGAGRGPLAGIRVLDLGTILAGPYAGSLMSGLGADVIKVESPAGDAFRETGFVYNRGMRGLAIDLSCPEGQAAFHRLACGADAMIENSRQGVAKRLRVDYDTLCGVNANLVTLSIAGFGERGPMAHKPAFDPVLQAMSGMMAAQGGDSDPALYTIPVNDVAAAVTTVLALCLGLYHRARTGEGQRTTTSLVAMSATMQCGELCRFDGRSPAVWGGRDYTGPSDADRFYRAMDGWIRVEAPSVAALGEALGVAKEKHDNAKAVEAALAASGACDAVERLNAAGVPAVVARHPAEVARDPSIARTELLTKRQFPDGRPYIVPHRYARFSRTENPPVGDAPGVGEHSREVLAEAGLTDAEIDQLIDKRAVVQGQPFVLKQLVNYR